MFAWLKSASIPSTDSRKSDFASIASHELRTPLSVIKWYTEILLDEDMGTLNEDQKKYIRVIESSNERAISLVTALLNVSRLELGTFSVSPEPLLITTVVEEVLKKQEKIVNEKKLSVKLLTSGQFAPVALDKGLTTLIITSVVDNAVRYATPSSLVVCTTTFSPSLVSLSVKNTGMGIREKEKEKVFTKMFRGSNVEDGLKGSGLALYITRMLLSLFGGSIYFESTENETTTFTINIPTTGMSKKKGTTRLE